jgi:hypothetical protein
MTIVASKPRRRTGGFVFAVAIVFALQAGALFWFGRGAAAPTQTVTTAPTFRLGDAHSQALAAVEDPTLFVLPHAQSFPEESWMKADEQPFEPKVWNEPLRWLKLSPEKLGAAFVAFVQSLPTLPEENISLPEATLTYPNLPLVRTVEAQSQLRIEGELASRRLLNHPALPAQVNAGAAPLTSSVVQLLVDPQGNVLSALLLDSGSGSADADEDALNIAKALRFESVAPAGPERAAAPRSRLTLGSAIFEWQSVPPTNGPAIVP